MLLAVATMCLAVADTAEGQYQQGPGETIPAAKKGDATQAADEDKPEQAPAGSTTPPAAQTGAPGTTGAPQAGQPTNKVTGTFSTLQNMGSDVEDLVGIEVTIVGTGNGLQAIVQTADGIPTAPAIVPVKVDGTRVSFPIPSMNGELMEFKGKVTPQGLTGKLDGKSLTLPRRKSYWQ